MGITRNAERNLLLPKMAGVDYPRIIRPTYTREQVLSAPRYQAKPLVARIGDLTHGICDSFEQDWVMRDHHTEAQATRAAARYNQRYEEWICR